MTDIEKQELVSGDISDTSEKNKICKNLCDNSCWRRWVSIHPCIRILIIAAFIIPWFMVYLVITDFDFTGTSTSIHYRDRCRGEYGCCEIYNQCIDKGQYLDGHSIKLHELAHDSLKSNCPSLEYIVNKYNTKYFPKNHDCGEFGCCGSIEVTCDNAMRSSFISGNNHGTVELFRENRKILPILNPKKDARGSNCNQYGTLYDIVNSYNYNYPSRELSWVDYIVGSFIFLFMFSIVSSK